MTKTSALGTRRRWQPTRPRFNANELFPETRYQMGIAPVLLVAGKLLLPLIIGGGTILVGGHLLKDALPELGVNTSNIPISAALGGAGTALMLGASHFPESIQPAATILGIAGIAGSLALLFQPPPKIPPVPNRYVSPEERVPERPEPEMWKVVMDSSNPLRNIWEDQKWDFLIENLSKTPRTVFAGLDIREVAHSSDPETDKPFFKSKVVDPTYGRKRITIPAEGSVKETLVSTDLDYTVWGYTVAVELFRELDSQEPFLTSDPIQIGIGVVG